VYLISSFMKISPVGAVLIDMNMQRVRYEADRDLMRNRVNKRTVQTLEIIRTHV